MEQGKLDGILPTGSRPDWLAAFPDVALEDVYGNCRFFLDSAIVNVILACGLVPRDRAGTRRHIGKLDWLGEPLGTLCDMFLPGQFSGEELALLDRLGNLMQSTCPGQVVRSIPVLSPRSDVSLPPDVAFYKEATRRLELLATAWKMEPKGAAEEDDAQLMSHELERAAALYQEKLAGSGVEGRHAALLAGVPPEDVS